MAIQKFPRPVNPKIKKQTDDQLAKVGQINQLVNDINKLNVVGPADLECFPLRLTPKTIFFDSTVDFLAAIISSL